MTKLANFFSQVKGRLDTRVAIDPGSQFLRMSFAHQDEIHELSNAFAIDQRNSRIMAISAEAQALDGKVAQSMRVVWPFEYGLIGEPADFTRLLRYVFSSYLKSSYFFRPLIMSSVSSLGAKVYREALTDCYFQAGARQLYLISSTLAAAIGAQIPIAHSGGNLVFHTGEGVSELALISMGSIVRVDAIRLGGRDFDRALMTYLYIHYSLQVSLQTVREIKPRLIGLDHRQAAVQLKITGRDLRSGYPKEISVLSSELLVALELPLKRLSDFFLEFLKTLPPQLSGDVMEKGVILTGGGALFSGLDYYLSQVAQIPVGLADEPDLCVIKGIKLAIENLDLYRSSINYLPYV